MVDALDSKSGVSNGVRVRVSSPVKSTKKSASELLKCTFFFICLNHFFGSAKIFFNSGFFSKFFTRPLALALLT